MDGARLQAGVRRGLRPPGGRGRAGRPLGGETRACVAAAEKVECALVKLGNEGVIVDGGWKGSQLPPRMILVPWYGPAQASTCRGGRAQRARGRHVSVGAPVRRQLAACWRARSAVQGEGSSCLHEAGRTGMSLYR